MFPYFQFDTSIHWERGTTACALLIKQIVENLTIGFINANKQKKNLRISSSPVYNINEILRKPKLCNEGCETLDRLWPIALTENNSNLKIKPCAQKLTVIERHLMHP